MQASIYLSKKLKGCSHFQILFMPFLSRLPHITSFFPNSECRTSRWQRGICWKSPQPAASPVHPKSGLPAGNVSSRASFLHWPLVSLVDAFSSCAYNSRGHTHLVSAECSALCFLKTFLSYQISVFGLPYPPTISLFSSDGAVFSQ